ncbi:MAG: RdgB/HAM1 family non-canonical purine NTP pyrophosphatase [Rhodospirillaceae bacterium]|jgi:XTP/dITP diphosphohydrolase|nr:RdgB/HAM1 family non-canonical purine NTP pyrophosphatase [Rhodospirillaceae bacterium]MBT5373622.1 RdgB/HAM1 family non-canonical purine NTP pyrophosphatase [Rhodospirillaceae bacterium]MBT5658954.1 RdgB/HAM1 family non-canonical purine NTP pyrophosphatase [Rhodospirillaceae bacterium]MBT5751147.1 RdgB/HAM1 family non-canonical purine NTP pyrophosphatase [Rhodospirillaceae bacterium]
MARRFEEKTLLIASHNPGKVREIAALLAPFEVEVISAAEKGLAEPEETGATFTENALLKARAAASVSGLPALADDSGLEVKALDGQPGIYSARWAGPDKDFNLAMRRIEDELSKLDTPSRAARFICSLALAWPDDAADGTKAAETFEGVVEGKLVWPPRGDKGFGYDPVFIPKGHNITFGEMEGAEKHAISHRADAFRKLVANCFDPRS